MATRRITDYAIYRWRYYIGYSLTIIILAGLLLFAGLFVPGGLTTSEMSTVATSAHTYLLPITPDTIVNYPYYLLQHAGLSLLGVSTLSIKLPSLVLALLSAIGMFLLLRQWFSRNIAAFASTITITSGQFLIVGQSGTPTITSLFFSIWVILAATMITRTRSHHFIWQLAFFVLAAFSLYTPLSIYALIAIAIIGIIHPHIRYAIKHLSKGSVLLFTVLSLLLITPIILSAVKHPHVLNELLGIPTHQPHWLANASALVGQYLSFMSPGRGAVMTPLFGLGSALLILIGFVDMFRSKYTARSYTIMAWLVLLVPILLMQPTYTTVLLVPLLLLLAMGMQMLIGYWYRLFPRNPYARIAGLIPLVVLVGGLVLSGIDRYTYGYYYGPAAASYSHDLALADKLISPHSTSARILVVSSNELPFYQVVASHRSAVSVTSAFPNDSHETIIVSHAAHTSSQPPADEIITSAAASHADRFYIYKNTP